MTLRYRLLGRSGLRVSEAALGTMTFGEEWGWGASKEESRRIWDAYFEAGGNFVDTANRYTEGTSERWIGEFMQADRDRVVLATKYTLFDRKGDPNGAGNHRKNMVRSLEASLRRLGTDRIDLFWVHAWDSMTPVEEVMRGLDDLVRAGKVLYVGVSDTPAWVVSRANTLAELRGWTPFCALQVEYSLAQRAVERELLPMARELDLAVTPWGSLAGGVLTGKYAADRTAGAEAARYVGNAQATRIDERNLSLAAVVRETASALGRSPAQVALAWVRQRPGVIIPIVGARRTDQLRDNLGAFGLELPEAMMNELDAVSRIELGFPHDFLAGENIVDLVSGGTRALIDDHRAPVRRARP
jgi:aryl-alcohol dehydrogenase-like predicted oxidoreductase